MKMKCENIVTCGNYNCELNCGGACIRTVVALDGDGKCVMYKPKNRPAPEVKTITKFPDGTETETSTVTI